MKLEVKNLKFYYRDGDFERIIFDDANAVFESGKIYAILGVSGSGKSTLLSLLATLDQPNGGEILLDGEDIFKDSDHYRQENMGFVFQNYNLIENMTGIENVELAMAIAKNLENRKNILGTLELVGIKEETARKKALKLSGGEQQRVAIARALINNPDIILADEPTGNLDEDTSDKMMDIFVKLAHEFQKCVILVTHNKELAKRCDVVYVVADKKITSCL